MLRDQEIHEKRMEILTEELENEKRKRGATAKSSIFFLKFKHFYYFCILFY